MTIPFHPRLTPLWLLILLQAGISASSLVVEIVAGRMIAPYVGMSLYTWTSIIAVVLAGFSVGHWWGGRIAGLPTDRALRITGWTMIAAACTTAGATLLLRATADPVLNNLQHPLAAITALSTLAFFLPSLFAGVPAPVLTVAAMRDRDQSERALGAMFAAGAIGAIAGTLLAGFLFVPWMGSVATLLVIAAIYVLAAGVCFWLGGASRREAMISVSGIGLVLLTGIGAFGLPPVCDRESSYYCIRTVAMSDDPQDPVNLMVVDHLAHGISSRNAPRVMFTEHAAMLDALPRMRMERSDFTSFHIGGGSYSVPRAWADRGISGITIAEIDPEVTAMAVDRFWFDPEIATILHRDARVALRNSAQQFDVIVGDAFTDIAVPEHLVTLEFFTLVSDRLNPGGVYAMNLLDNVDRLHALAAVVATLRAVFPSVEVWTVRTPPQPGERRVFVLLASAEDSPVSMIETAAPDMTRFQVLETGFVDTILDQKNARILTDDHAPLSHIMGLDPVIN
ncbi:MAG: fused MFS/spermidine synthase [Hoeflea sp.]|uniref:fused MFS/spermidine synthase n=1 Tax=Hoeflea sp. TaxID=1940281 RepID=UPI001D8A99DA|nr:fused MFS/spermidine synthase [Hoeflea sp.]MBU4527168.1 fused MFS/spermidine synthase [Alphaproteobacteria bacterium]MBU4544815.1 fused MFS/spermidine synthase [Alphaproteobacteria bacterium]MBU4551439.1 fused MFS/spermidine synthase [Alphaproteobacteria bacterium]MBV1725444.1 fused MFS/spermidine synthase [Hoeflea sp.]MBV1759492.1 fused MFS/spermidine synthase [Hoeflea sp.]